MHPPRCDECLVEFPHPHVMLVTLARPKKMNSVPKALHWQLDALFQWFDDQTSLRVAVFTGQGDKSFCAGSDLLDIERGEAFKRSDPGNLDHIKYLSPQSGFAGLSRRKGKKPVIAAVNGLALGGGFEIVLNCDITIASPHAEFGLPEPLVGVYASGGGLPRLIHSVGLAAAGDIALTGRRVSAQEAYELRLISRLSKTPQSVVAEALEIAQQIASISPDAIIVTRAGLREAWETASVERAYQITHEQLNQKLTKTENHDEGLAAFREKRRPVWRDAKL